MDTEEKEKDIGDESSIESIEDLFVFFKTFLKAGLKGIGMAFLVGVFTFSILDKVIDFDEYDSFTLSGVDYAPPEEILLRRILNCMTKCKKSILMQIISLFTEGTKNRSAL